MEQKLFTSKAVAPLAHALRPRNLDEFVGQKHLVGPGGPLHDWKMRSCLLWGPPGCGKTTLARILAERAQAELESISPVSAGVADLRDAVARARLRRDDLGIATIIFVDEAHRFNKSQQDYFLPHVEEGLLTFIGATTENPSFEINSALLSRLVVHRLEALDENDLRILLDRSLDHCGLEVQEDAAAALLSSADGDGRRLINMVERFENEQTITMDKFSQEGAFDLRRFDKQGDDFYDQISAMIKSIRGSSPEGALYWLCRMLDGGADPRYLSRRLIRSASEDIGLADPHALKVALSGDDHYRRLGSPEGELGLALAAVYLACAPKSNSIDTAYAKTRKLVQESGSLPVPKHLRNAPTDLMRSQGNSEGYRFPHDEEHGYAAGESYLPKEINADGIYVPKDRGFEERIAKRLRFLHELDQKSRNLD